MGTTIIWGLMSGRGMGVVQCQGVDQLVKVLKVLAN